MNSELTWGKNVRASDPSKVDQRAATVAQMIVDRVGATPDAEAFRFPVTDGDAERWDSITWGEVGERSRNIAAGLLSLGIEIEERVAIASATRYEWILADFGVMLAGAATTTIYPTTTPDDVAHILSDSGSRLLFAEDDQQIAKALEYRAEIGDVQAIITFDGRPDPDGELPVLSLPELERRGAQYLSDHPDAVEDAMARIDGESLATLIYTSGTTGKPKGVRLVHDCWTYEGACIDAVNLLDSTHFQYLWLPLSHSFGKVLLSAQLQVGFASAVDGRVDRIVDNLATVEPVWMCSAPRVFEKAYARIVGMIRQDGGIKEKLFDWAFRVGFEVSDLRQQGKEPAGLLGLKYRLADRLVFSKIRARFGSNLRFFVSGAAALNQDIAKWFHAAGILILEGYGLTETSAATFVNLPGIFRLGTVGPPFPGTEVKTAEDGEVLVKGPGVMRGYHNLPEQTAAVLSEDGWFATGDVGEVTDEGLLKITDRKKDVFKTSGGKYVAPSLIEAMFKTIFPYVSQIVVHGENRNFVSALITLDPDTVQAWAESAGLSGKSYQELVESEVTRRRVQQAIDELNAKLNRWETIKKFVILPNELTVDDGEMTPSLKVRRRAVEERYSETLDALYS